MISQSYHADHLDHSRLHLPAAWVMLTLGIASWALLLGLGYGILHVAGIL